MHPASRGQRVAGQAGRPFPPHCTKSCCHPCLGFGLMFACCQDRLAWRFKLALIGRRIEGVPPPRTETIWQACRSCDQHHPMSGAPQSSLNTGTWQRQRLSAYAHPCAVRRIEPQGPDRRLQTRLPQPHQHAPSKATINLLEQYLRQSSLIVGHAIFSFSSLKFRQLSSERCNLATSGEGGGAGLGGWGKLRLRQFLAFRAVPSKSA